MTTRSSNSTYCQDELGLAEEFKKPIISLRVENVTDMDPGLKLITQRRQWIDFTSSEKFLSSMSELLEGLESQEIFPSGDTDEEEKGAASLSVTAGLLKLKVDSHTMNVPTGGVEKTGNDEDYITAIRMEFNERLKNLEMRVATLEEKLSAK